MTDLIHKGHRYIVLTPEDVRRFSWKLGGQILDRIEEFKPDFVLALWRGGAQVGIYVQEYLMSCRVNVDHVCIRTSSYSAPGVQESVIDVHTLEYILKTVKPTDKLLIVDDIFDSGRSLKAVIDKMTLKLGESEMPSIRIATMYWKIGKNKTLLKPDYVVFDTDIDDAWIVLPHEVSDFSLKEDILALFGADVLGQLR